MASTYPTTVDAFSTAHADGTNEVIHASTINDLADAVNKLEKYSHPVYNVKGFGAKGDGATDDTAAIQAALNSTPTGIVIVPASASAYLVTAPLLIPDGVTLRGMGPNKSVIQAKTGFSGAAVVMNADNSGAQEYAWLENIFVHGAGIATSCVIFDRVFVNSGLERVIGGYATGDGIVIKSNVAMCGPLFLRDIWVLSNAHNGLLIGDFAGEVMMDNITAENSGSGFAEVKILGPNTSCIRIDGLHMERGTGSNMIGLLVDSVHHVDIRNVRVFANGAATYSDVVKIQNTVGGSVVGFSVFRIKTSTQVTNFVNDVVNARTIAVDADFNLESYQTDPFRIDGLRAVGGSGQPAFAGDWANNGGGYRPLSFYKDATGIVHIEGVIKTPGGQLAGAAVFTLPTGYRPAAAVQTIALRADTNAVNDVTVFADGQVKVGTAVGATGIIALNLSLNPS